MSNIVDLGSGQVAHGPLPIVAMTRGGADFFPNDDLWIFRDAVTDGRLAFGPVLAVVSAEVGTGLKATLIWLLKNRAVATAMNALESFKHMLKLTGRSKATPLLEVTQFDVLSYRASLSKKQVNRLLMLAVLLKKWHALGLVGVSADAIALLKSLKHKKVPSGEPVMTMCPIRGPLTQLEDESFQEALNTAFVKGDIDETEFFAVWLTRAIGQRPCQTAALKVCDLVVERHTDGSVEYLLNVPRAKQRNTVHPRSSWKVRPLIQQIGAPLSAYLLQVLERFRGEMHDPSQAPIFPAIDSPWRDGSYAWHMTAPQMGALISRVSTRIKAHSERTGTALHVSPTRLRRTVGTRAAQEGHGELVVAEILDHTNVASARYYVEAVPSIAGRIDSAMAHSMAPLARAFQGLAPEVFDADGNGATNLIIDLRFDQRGQPMGQCTGGDNCTFLAPVSCYTCRSFRPWLDGPHHAVLDELIARRDMQITRNGPRMASVNDRTLVAVAEVIQICSAKRMEALRG